MKTIQATELQEQSIPCFECETGFLQPVLRQHTVELPDGKKLTIPDVPMLECHVCGDLVTGDEGNDYINAYLDKALNAISPEEVQEFLRKYNLTQKEAAQITGFGEKNISRWASGNHRPSESVSNFLRLLLADEMAFERLKTKNFKGNHAPSSYPQELRAPDDEETEILKLVDYPKLVEIGIVKETRKPTEKRTELCRWSRSADLLEFQQKMQTRLDLMAAYKDSQHKSNPVSRGLWVALGENAAANINTAPYSRDKLREAVKNLRNITTHSLAETASEVQSILAKAGVALVFIPVLKESAMRGCTRLLSHNKALIIHGLKYRSLSQFWVILFHEMGHLLLHISEPGQTIPDYEEASDDPRESQADEWAFDTLASRDAELEFLANHPKPQPWQLQKYADRINLHPAIAAEILNRRADQEIISFAYLKKEKMFPHLTEEETKQLMATSYPVS
ncbi:MAG: type II toxin-antitoxin system MqsA family antitoxin [Verrucomicrobia bacterium]|nr:type II toxin-antitoxin system MqsA family antitoxin [Verrucomicrobiota bacterium]